VAAADKRGSVGAKHARRYCTPDWLACCAFSEAEVMVCWEHGERVGGSRLRHATRARCHRRLQLVPPEHDVVSRAQPSTSWTAAPAPADVVRVGLSRRRERRRIDSKLTFRGGGRYCTLDRSTRICLTDLSIMVSWGGRRTAGRYRGRRCNVCASQSARAYFARYSVCSARRCPQTKMVARARISW